jgi:hypothetical protein
MLASVSGALLRGRVARGVVVCAGELGADLASVGVLQVFEDGEGLLPGLPGLGQLAGGVAGVAEAGEGARFAGAVAGFPGDAERALVTGGGFGEVAQVVLGVPQAVPGISLDPAVVCFSVQGDCLAAEHAGLLVVAEKPVVPADVIERCCLSRFVVDGLAQAHRLLRVPERVGVAALTSGQHTETVLDSGLAEAVAQPLVKREAAGVVAKGLIMVAEIGAGACQQAAGYGLRGGTVSLRIGQIVPARDR